MSKGQPRGAGPRFALLLSWTALAAGCVAPSAVTCDDGTVCAAGLVCVAGGCAEPEALTACATLDEGASCALPEVGFGQCIAGVCLVPICGDGEREGAEVCDDGNRVDGDGCSAFCASVEGCGNGFRDVGEECDDGNDTTGDDCQPDCKLPRCGDGALDSGELCDDGNLGSGDGCNASCSSDEACGNGVVDPGEQCDDGNVVDHDTCQSTCVVPRCGDGIQGPDEVCDDGNQAADDGCAGDCRSNETCGNGAVDYAIGEQCDDGNLVDHDGCQSSCVVQRCGDGIVDPAEACDDGNRTAGDGCASDCGSSEGCGNGVVDEVLAEVCDDGGLVSHDGCDSACQPEALGWRASEAAPILTPGTQHGVVDELRGELVHHEGSTTWTWDETWRVAAAAGPSPAWFQLVYDADRAMVMMVGQSTAGGAVDQLWEWTGAAWSARGWTGTPPQDAVAVTYDGTRDVVLVLARSGQPSAWSAADGTWTALPAAPFDLTLSVAMAHDRTGGDVVVLTGGQPSERDDCVPGTAMTWTWDGATWTGYPGVFPGKFYRDGGVLGEAAPARQALIHDAARGGVVALGGIHTFCSDGGDYVYPATARFLWTGAAWTKIDAGGFSARFASEAAYDPTTGTTLLMGGIACQSGPAGDCSRLLTDLWTETGGVWTQQSLTSRDGHAIAFDRGRRQLVLFGGHDGFGTTFQDTWAWDGEWRRLAVADSPPARATGNVMAFDPGRGQVVMFDGTSKATWALGPDAWVDLEISPPSSGTGRGMAYDYAIGALILVTAGATSALASGSTSWVQIGSAPTGTRSSLAYDPARGAPVFADGAAGIVYQLGAGVWTQTFAPGPGYRAVESVRRRSTYLVPSLADVVWERSDGAWLQRSAQPVAVDGPVTADPSRDRLLAVGRVGNSMVVLERELSSTLADESCAPGADLDGDGQAGCDDRDCWWACTPTCPPLHSCAP